MKNVCFFTLIFWSIASRGQFEEISCPLSSNNSSLTNAKVIDQHLIVTRYHSLYRINLTTGEYSYYDISTNNVNKIYYNSQGGFFVKTIYQEDNSYARIYFAKTNGTLFESPDIWIDSPNSNPTVSLLQKALSNDRLYVTSFDEVLGYTLWECDGTDSGTSIIFTSDAPIANIYDFNGTLIIAVISNGMNYYKREPDSELVLFDTVPISEVETSGSGLGFHNGYTYFNTSVNDQDAIYRLNTDSVELFSTGQYGSELTFLDNSFYLLRGGNYYYELYSGSMDNPSLVSEVPFSPGLSFSTTAIRQRIGLDYYLVLSAEEGFELARINDFGQLELLTTDFPGPASSVPICPEGYDYPGIVFPRSSADSEASCSYMILRCEVDNLFYLYKLQGWTYTRLFRMDSYDSFFWGYSLNDELYTLLQDESLCLYKRDLSDIDIPEPLPPDTTAEAWFNQIGLLREGASLTTSTFGNRAYDVLMDEEGNVTVLFKQYTIFNDVFTIDNTEAYNFETNRVFAKFNNTGQLLWMKAIGDYSLTDYNCPFQMKYDENGDIVVYGMFYENGIFDDITLTDPGYALFVCKLDGETGDVIWVNKIGTTINPGNALNEAMTILSNNTIVISFVLDDNYTSIDGFPVYTDYEPTNVQAILSNTDGTVLNVNVLEDNWGDYYGETYVLESNQKGDKCISIQSRGWYNWSSSCEYSTWPYLIREFDAEGNLLQTKSMISSDLGSITEGIYLPNGKFMGFGFVRGTTEMDWYNFETEMGEYCNVSRCFGFLLNPETWQIEKGFVSADSSFFPIDIDMDDQYVYLYGFNQFNRSCIVRFDFEGNYQGLKLIGNYSSVFDFGWYEKMDLNNGYIAIVGAEMDYNPGLEIIPQINYCPSIGVLKIANDNWSSPNDWFKTSTMEQIVVTSELLIYPNPFDREISFVYAAAPGTYTHFSITDTQGRIIDKGSLQAYQVMNLPVDHLPQGSYLLRLEGPSASVTKKIIRISPE